MHSAVALSYFLPDEDDPAPDEDEPPPLGVYDGIVVRTVGVRVCIEEEGEQRCLMRCVDSKNAETTNDNDDDDGTSRSRLLLTVIRATRAGVGASRGVVGVTGRVLGHGGGCWLGKWRRGMF
jgi:hypothetical protein